MTLKTNSLGHETHMEYDKNDNLTTEIDPNGNIKNYLYTKTNKLKEKHLPDNTIIMSYDVRGNLTEVYDDNTRYTYTYLHHDDKELLESVVFEGIGDRADLMEHTVTNEHNDWGDLVKVSDIRGDSFFSYNSRRQISSLKNHKGEIFNFAFDEQGRVETSTRPGSVSTYSYDTRSYLKKIVHKTGVGSTIASFDYERNVIGMVNSVTTESGQISYLFDANMQLTSSQNSMAQSPYNLEEFSYDSIGNRSFANDEYKTRTYDQSGQRLQSDWRFEYIHDNNGNLVQKNEKETLGVNYIKYDYSSSNQLIRVEEYIDGRLVKEIDYLYGATGQRIEKIVSDINNPDKSVTRRYSYVGEEISAELDENNNILAKYTHSGLKTDDVLAVDVQSGGVGTIAKEAKSYFYLKDALGTIIGITDSSGAEVQHHIYSAFGKLIKIENSSNNDITETPVLEPFFAFTGREYDKETGLYYYRARMYDSNSGRFMQVDPHPGKLTNPLTVANRYSYAGNNPVNYLDPDGRLFWLFLGAAALIGGITVEAKGGSFFQGLLIGAGSFLAGFGAGALFSGALGLSGAGAIIGGAFAGGAAGGIVGGLGFEAFGVGSYKEGFWFGAGLGAGGGALGAAKFGTYGAEVADFFGKPFATGAASITEIAFASLLPASFYIQPIACDSDESFDTWNMKCVPSQFRISKQEGI